MPIPNIRKLQDRGVNFVNFYCNVPICAPSRASVWSGRQPHNGLHKHNNITVRGYWNNYEGVGACSDPESVGAGRRDGCAPSIDGKVTVTEQQLIAPMLEASGKYTRDENNKKNPTSSFRGDSPWRYFLRGCLRLQATTPRSLARPTGQRAATR